MKNTSKKAQNNWLISQPDPLDVPQLCDNIAKFGFAHINGLLPDELLRALHNEVEQLDHDLSLKSAGIGRGKKHKLIKNIRSDKIKWLDGSTLAQRLLQDKLEDLRLQINRELMLGLFDIESHFAVYRKGDFYKRHLDSFKGQKNRLLSMVIYLNPKWNEEDRGLLNVYKDEESTLPFASVIPNWGECVIFLSEEIPHEVTAANRTRYSIATWFRCNNQII